jgi:hypothetical protein
MNQGLHLIRFVEPDLYEVAVDLEGERRTMHCRVIDHGGIRIVRPTPDLTSSLPFDPRLLAAAVIAFANARARTTEPSVEQGSAIPGQRD